MKTLHFPFPMSFSAYFSKVIDEQKHQNQHHHSLPIILADNRLLFVERVIENNLPSVKTVISTYTFCQPTTAISLAEWGARFD
jgi:hypothetical protein